MATCIAAGCGKQAANQLGLRLRKPWPRKAVWAPDIGAYLCKDHAEAGGTFVIECQPPAQNGRVDVTVTVGGNQISSRQYVVTKTAV